jgi:hypothetical protein
VIIVENAVPYFVFEGGYPVGSGGTTVWHFKLPAVLRIRDVLSRIRISKFFIPDPGSESAAQVTGIPVSKLRLLIEIRYFLEA